MKLLTERAQVRTVAARWREHYGDLARGREYAARLDALDTETATAEDVAAALDGRRWVAPGTCHECRDWTWDLVELGEEPDYDSCTVSICRACLTKALELLG